MWCLHALALFCSNTSWWPLISVYYFLSFLSFQIFTTNWYSCAYWCQQSRIHWENLAISRAWIVQPEACFDYIGTFLLRFCTYCYLTLKPPYKLKVLANSLKLYSDVHVLLDRRLEFCWLCMFVRLTIHVKHYFTNRSTCSCFSNCLKTFSACHKQICLSNTCLHDTHCHCVWRAKFQMFVRQHLFV